MKHIYLLFAVLTISTTALAQLPDGSIAPDFTATDINGNEWNLYDLLDEGNTVILDFSATSISYTHLTLPTIHSV